MGQAKNHQDSLDEAERFAFAMRSHPCIRCGEPAEPAEILCEYCGHVTAKSLRD